MEEKDVGDLFDMALSLAFHTWGGDNFVHLLVHEHLGAI